MAGRHNVPDPPDLSVPSTSCSEQCNIPMDSNEAKKRLSSATAIMQAKATREEIDALFDQMENELYRAQCLAFWKQSAMYETNLKLQDLIGRRNEPEHCKEPTVKIKGPRAKKTDKLTRENSRRSDRDCRSQSGPKGRGKDSPTPSATVSEQSLTSRRRGLRAPEMTEGRSMQRKRAAGRPRLPRKRQASCIGVETIEGTNHSEELYCLCRQPAFGDMICCDNKKCDEWFHFTCVQLRVKPKGNWYCPSCRGDRCDVINPGLEE